MGSWRAQEGERAFSIIESTIALVIVFGVLLVLLRGLDTGFRVVVETRRQAAASALASELLERARSLEWDNIGLTDASNDADCPPAADGVDGVGCPTWTATPYNLSISTDSDGDYTFEGEKVVFLNPASTFDPFLSFHSQLERDNQVFDRFLFVTSVVDGSGSEQWRRITAVVQWDPQTGFRREIRQVTYASAFEEPSQPFLNGSIDYDGGSVTVSGSAAGNRGVVEGTSDWLDPADVRPDLVETVEFPDAQLSAVTDYVSGATAIVEGTVGDLDWSDGTKSTVGGELLDKRADDDYGSAPALNDPLSLQSLSAWEINLAAPHDFVTREETDDGSSSDQATFSAQAWTQYTADSLPYSSLDISSAEATPGYFTEYSGVGYAAEATYFLKGDGVPEASLSTTAPTATTLPNYDSSRDSDPGLLLQISSLGLSETDPLKYQVWSTGDSVNLDGPTDLVFWSAMRNFDTTNAGEVLAALLDCNSSLTNCTTIATGSLTAGPWSGSGTWVERTIDFGSVTYTISGGRNLAVKLVVGANADDAMWFAYDTVSYPSRLNINDPGLLGAPYRFRLFHHGATFGPALGYTGTVDRYEAAAATRRVDVAFTWDGEVVYFAHDEAYGAETGGAFLGWFRVDLPSISGTLSAGEAAPAPSLTADNVTIWAWDPTGRVYVKLYEADYDSLTSSASVSTSINYELATGGYPRLKYDLNASFTVSPPIITEAFDGNGARSMVIVQAPTVVSGTISYRVEDTAPPVGVDGLLFDVDLVIGLGGVDASAQYINPDAP
jgi:hypothetical protein